MAKKNTTPDSLYGTSRDYLKEQEKKNELLAEIAGSEYTAPEDLPNSKYLIEKRLLDAAQIENEFLEDIADGAGTISGANKLAIDYGTDILSLKKGDTAIADSGVTLPAYGVSFNPSTGGLTLTKNGTAISGQTVTIPNYGSPVAVEDSTDMTDHDTIYLYEGTTGETYTNGHFYYWDGAAWADGGEYAAATVQTDKTLLVEDRAADAKVTGDKVAELKSEINGVETALCKVESLIPIDCTFTENKGIRYEDGTLSETISTIAYTSYVDISNYDKIVYTRLARTVSSSELGMAFYSEKTTSSYISGQKVITSASADQYVETEIDVPNNAKYARFSVFNSNKNGFYVKGINQTARQIEEIEESLILTNTAIILTNTAIKNTYKATEYAYTINKGQRLNETTGISESYSLACRTGIISGLRYIVGYELLSDTYEYEAFYYGTNGSVSTGADYIGHGSFKNAFEYLPANAIKVAFTFRRKDSGTITNSDITSIRSAFVIYTATDRALENIGVPADAKTVGERFNTLDTNLQYYGVYKINSLTTGWKVGKYARIGNVSTGSVVETRDDENYDCLQIGCSEGDVFIITGDGGTGYTRAYGFSDANNKIFANSNVSPASTAYTNKILVAPEGSSWLWITKLKTHDGTNAKLLTIKNRVDGLQNQSGMKIVNFGDSIFGNFRATSGVNKSISNMLNEMTNATYSNVAIGGTHSGDSDNAQGEAIQTNTPLYDFTALVTAIISGDFTAQYADGSHDDVMNILSAIDFSTIDIITISYGTNDWSYATSIAKYKSNLLDGITRMLTAYPNLRVILCTPIIRFKSEGGVIYDSDSDQMMNGKNKKVPDYATAVVELCMQHHFICCDNYWTLGINTYNRAKFFGVSEMVHPNVVGRKAIASQLASIINKA